MYKVLIVDDEASVRSGLRDCVNWEAYNCTIVSEAGNGQQALSAVEKYRPDLVITDVRMPKMSGIQLAEQLTNQYPGTKIVFVSGYDDVAFLKSAFKVGAVNYILKPIDIREFEDTVRQITQTLDQTQKKNDMLHSMESKLIQSMPLLQGRFFMTLINDHVKANQNLMETMDFLGVQFDPDGYYCVAVIVVDNPAPQDETYSEREYQCMSFAILNICQELMEKYFTGYIFENNRGEYVCLLALQDDSEEEKYKLIAFAEDVKNNLLRWFELSVTIGLSPTLAGIGGLPDGYRSAVNAVEQKLFVGKNKIIVMEEQDSRTDGYKFDFSLIDTLKDILKTGNFEKLSKEVASFFDELIQNRAPLKYVQSICLSLILMSNQVIWENLLGDEGKSEQTQIEDFFALDTLEDMQSFILRLFQTACQRIAQKMDGKKRNLIVSVKHFIEENYAKHITINDIARELYFNSTYLSFIFKQETGKTINDYITQIRIEKAKQLLRDPKIKVDDVCYRVGYQEPSYFSKLFKKHTGLSPRQYRETL